MIEENHCCIELAENLRLTARAETYVNGQLVSSAGVDLHHGDRVIIGGTHFFHLHYPRDCKLADKQSQPKVQVTFSHIYKKIHFFHNVLMLIF